MKQRKTAGGEAQKATEIATNFADAGRLDAQFAELIETVWACELNWTLDDRVDAAIRYGRYNSKTTGKQRRTR